MIPNLVQNLVVIINVKIILVIRQESRQAALTEEDSMQLQIPAVSFTLTSF